MRRLPAALLVSGRALACSRLRKAALKRTQSKRFANSAPADTDQAVLELWAGELLKGTLYVSRASPCTLTNAALVAALGAETDFTLWAYLARFLSPQRSRRSRRNEEGTTVRPVCPSAPFVAFVFFVVEAGSPQLTADNFTLLAEEIAKHVATSQSGRPTTLIGPLTTGTHVLDEFCRDALGGEWRCTGAGTPGTWIQNSAGGGEG